MDKKIKVSFFLPELLQRELKEKMIKDGYDLKGKSKWVAEAVQSLISRSSFEDLVKVSEGMGSLGKQESILFEKELKTKIDEAVITIRKKYPDTEGVQSCILRTAIMQRLILG